MHITFLRYVDEDVFKDELSLFEEYMIWDISCCYVQAPGFFYFVGNSGFGRGKE